MFYVEPYNLSAAYIIPDDKGKFLHSDGSIYTTAEYWPTKEDAQKVLDKFQPKPKHEWKHEWKHGDVFENSVGIQIYLEPKKGPMVCGLTRSNSDGTPEIQLDGAKFLFNIKEKI